ncbi:MAG: methyl-accepting chemotaxis protein [Actinobacteria bacterium]|nr:methyl-accepting chemotaxis protein [Actinomycetota bacterium]
MSATTSPSRPGFSLAGLGVRGRLYALVGVMLALWVISAGVGIYGLNQAKGAADTLVRTFDSANHGNDAYTSWASEDAAVNMVIALEDLKDPAQAQLIDETWAVATEEHAAALQGLDDMIAAGIPEFVPLAEKAKQAMVDYEGYVDTVKTQIKAGDLVGATKTQTVDNYPASTAAVEAFDGMNVQADALVAATGEQLSADVAKWTMVVVVVLLIGLVTALVLTARIVKGITQPLGLIDTALGRLADGDLSVRVDIHRADELGRVATSLNRAAESQQKSVSAIADSAQMLAAAAEELTATSNLMSTAAETTSAQAVQVVHRSGSVNESVQTAATATDQLTASIAQISSSAWDAAKVASSAVEVAERTTQIMDALGTSSRDIETVIKEIRGVAEQTNLLALNATIESARAGEAGKGFAVVASEVKDLARATATATTDITAKIQAISDDTGSAITAITQISGTIAQINEIQHSIASAVEEQTAAINEIARSMNEVSSGSQDIGDSINGVNDAAQSASSGAEQTRTAATELAQMASTLEGLVGSFRY